MPDKIFLDTNILIYSYSITELEKKERVLSILESESLIISVQVINEFIWVMNRKFNIALDVLHKIVNKLWEKFYVIGIERSTVNTALKFAVQYRYSYWDSLVVASALESGCTILYTEDMQHGQVIENTLTIKNPFIT